MDTMDIGILLLSISLSILPEGSVRNEGVFLTLIFILIVFIGIAVYLRRKNR
jgi:hypothetical protein